MTVTYATVTSGDRDCVTGQVPSTSVPGDYRLRLEGDHRGGVGGSVFVNETRLQFDQRFLTVLIQTSRPLYTFGQDGQWLDVYLRTGRSVAGCTPSDRTVSG